MFAARIDHPLKDGALSADRAEFDAALARWTGFLAARSGFRRMVVLGDPGQGRVEAISIWDDAESFQAAFADPGRADASDPLMAFFAAPTAPDFPLVLTAI